MKRRGVWWMGDNLEKDSGLFDKQMEELSKGEEDEFSKVSRTRIAIV